MHLQRDWSKPRNIDALLKYAHRIRDRDALVILATDEHALEERHMESIRRIARTHPMVLIDVATINPFDDAQARTVFNASNDRRVPRIPTHWQNSTGGSHAPRISVRIRPA